MKQMVNREAVTPPSAWRGAKTQQEQAAYANSATNNTKSESELGNTGDFNV